MSMMIMNNGSGARIVRSLLLATSGLMPSWMVSSISKTLRALLVKFGPQNALAWLSAALRDNMVPRRALTSAYKLEMRDALLSSDALANDPSFKRTLKFYCGGKKKGKGPGKKKKSSSSSKGWRGTKK